MRDFLYYLTRIARRGVAVALAALGLVGEAIRLASANFPVPRWVDLTLLMAGLVWGGYAVYRDKPIPTPPVRTGPTPASRFHSSLSTSPRHLPMSEVVVGFSAIDDSRFSEDQFDAIDKWIASLNPESVPSRSDRSFIRRQVHADNDLMWHVQVDPPGPVVSIDKVIHAHDLANGTAVSLQELFDSWNLVSDELPRLSAAIGGPPTRMAVALQPYPSERGPVIDLWFGELPQPDPTGQAGMVIPWQEIFEDDDLVDFPERAARSLLRHFGYRGLDETLISLQESRSSS